MVAPSLASDKPAVNSRRFSSITSTVTVSTVEMLGGFTGLALFWAAFFFAAVRLGLALGETFSRLRLSDSPLSQRGKREAATFSAWPEPLRRTF
jgi:hypothetical protein